MKTIERYDKKQTIIMLFFVLIGAFLIRWETINQPRDFWIDESFQYEMSQKSVSFILESPDVHSPLFNLFTKGLFELGIDTIWGLRFVMILLSVLFLTIFYFTMKEIFNGNVAIYSSLLVAFSLTFTYYATEFRSYTFALVLVILQIKYFNRILNDRGRFSAVYYWIFSLLMIYTHYMTGLILLSQFVFLLIYRRRLNTTQKQSFLQILLMLFIGSIPLIIYFFNTIPKIHSFWFKTIDLTSFLSTFQYIIAPAVKNSLFFMLFYIFILVGILRNKKDFKWKDKQFLIYLFLPVIFLWIISQINPLYHHRYFLFGGLSFYILLGWVFDRFDNSRVDMGLFFCSLFLLLTMITFPSMVESFNTELLESAVFISEDVDEIDIFVHTSTFSYLPYKVYYPENRHFLKTNLTEEQLFTAGGSVVEDDYIVRDFDRFEGLRFDVYGVSDDNIFEEEVMNVRGLYVSKIVSED